MTAVGGIIGFARTGSLPSAIAGGSVGILCEPFPPFSSCCPLGFLGINADGDGGEPQIDAIGAYRIQNNQPYGIEISLLASLVLAGASVPRAIRLRKPVPILLSVLATFGILTFGSALRRRL